VKDSPTSKARAYTESEPTMEKEADVRNAC